MSEGGVHTALRCVVVPIYSILSELAGVNAEPLRFLRINRYKRNAPTAVYAP